MDNASNNNMLINSLAARTRGYITAANQAHCGAHILNLVAKAILSLFSNSQIDNFDVEMDSDTAVYELNNSTTNSDEVEGWEDDEAEDEVEDDEIDYDDLPTLMDRPTDEQDEDYAPSAMRDRSNCFVHKVRSS